MEGSTSALVPYERIESKIYLIRGQKVMLDRDLAVLYGVTTGALNQAVRRNLNRFPSDFMFKLTSTELKILISQTVISNEGRGGVRKEPLVFTEQGIAMLSSVLKSERAILVNIQIIRTFTKLREMIAQNADLRLKLEALEMRYDQQFKIVFDAIRLLLAEDETPPTEIGFTHE
ncbi:ORF6N domain-containing protein [Candidatus Uhrbacteria bacterium]|nr:ORF6N domain-containing protein [Candidatus Uhrbacteria bacterium]